MKTVIRKVVMLTALCGSTVANATVVYSGYTFEDNAFADAVVSYNPGPDVGAGYNVGSAALGQPDYSGANNTAASLGDAGSLIVQFTDNSLTTSGDSTADLFIFEIGGAVEYFNVAISTNNIDWIDIGNVLGQPIAIDIDAIAGVTLWEQYSYVKLTDVLPNQSGHPYGEADIDAVAAISSAPPAGIPEPATVLLMSLGLAGLGFRGKK